MAAILDTYSRSGVGWQTADSLQSDLVIKVFKKAYVQETPPAGLLFHCDRDSQYACEAFHSLLKTHRATPSMSRKANCYDNDPLEFFWATLTTECFGSFITQTKKQISLMIFEYIHYFYN